ncbi:MAG: hypothetical protein HYU99_00605 [Deltaproteobacteria bacterium]|nr:hypothetical protein [Deltaproteobacteria bacterium]
MGEKCVTMQALLLFICFVVFPSVLLADDRCPGADSPPPPVLKADLPKISAALDSLQKLLDLPIWEDSDDSRQSLRNIFDTVPQKTKLEQFFQLLFLLQKKIPSQRLPLTVKPPGITDVLLAAKVFTAPDFPKKITSVTLTKDRAGKTAWFVSFADSEVRFPINKGAGFDAWDQGMCQAAKELVFYPGFSFSIRKARNSANLIVENFDKVEIFGSFGSRGLFTIDLNYVDLEKVEFIQGTDEGKVTARVAKREFRENRHSSLFKFIGTLIPNTSRQRIDW